MCVIIRQICPCTHPSTAVLRHLHRTVPAAGSVLSTSCKREEGKIAGQGGGEPELRDRGCFGGNPTPSATHQHDAAVSTQDLGALLNVLGELLVAEGGRAEEKGERGEAQSEGGGRRRRGSEAQRSEE